MVTDALLIMPNRSAAVRVKPHTSISRPTVPFARTESGSVAQIHDYIAKLRHPSLLGQITGAARALDNAGPTISLADTLRHQYAAIPGPISINLDLTVACNYCCRHCIDGPLLNTGHSYKLGELIRSLVILRLAGLRSVILIGGGEPTLHPKFREVVQTIKALGLSCAIVSNGSNNSRIRDVAPWLTTGDWVRLSLDSATQQTFRAMHLPRKADITLETICSNAADIKQANPELSLGFSYIVTWQGASVRGQNIEDNVSEMAAAARLAKSSGFDFIAFKPLLDRDELGGESITVDSSDKRTIRQNLVSRIFSEFLAAKTLEDARFRVYGSLNLHAMNDAEALSRMRLQPQRCHMHLLRQVLTPIGVFGCPVYRGNAKDQIAFKDGYSSVDDFFRSRRHTCELIDFFDASVECRNVACLYNSTNWWIQAIREGLDDAPVESFVQEFFL